MAVYTHVEHQDLVTFLTAYDIGEVVSYKGIAEGVENSNYLLRTRRDGVTTDHILTLYEKRVSEHDLPYFLALVDHLSAQGIACPAAIHDRAGRALGRLSGRPAAIFTFLNGLAIDRIKMHHCGVLGAGLASLHNAGASFDRQRENSLSLAGWRDLAAKTSGRADEIDANLANLIDTELDWLASAWPGDLPSGVIHADLFPDNVFFLDDRLSGFIDFYFACNDLLAYDLAICLNAWCFDEKNVLKPDHAAALFGGYQTVRTLDPAEVMAMPVLARGAAMRFLLTRLYDWFNHPEGAMVRPKDPREYSAKLAFHRHVDGPQAYGL